VAARLQHAEQGTHARGTATIAAFAVVDPYTTSALNRRITAPMKRPSLCG